MRIDCMRACRPLFTHAVVVDMLHQLMRRRNFKVLVSFQQHKGGSVSSLAGTMQRSRPNRVYLSC